MEKYKKVIHGSHFCGLARNLLIMVFLLYFSAPLASQKQRIRFERISIEQGLSQSAVNCIIQDKKGYMWFGTQDGLNKYNGYKFSKYKHEKNNPSSISNNYIWTLYIDRTNHLWIGTDDGGLNKYDSDNDTFQSFTHSPVNSSSLSSNKVRAICEDYNGNLWIGTEGGGLNQFLKTKKSFQHYRHQAGESSTLSSDRIAVIIKGQGGTLWIGTNGGGLNRFNPGKNIMTHFKHDPKSKNSLSHNNITSLYEDGEGILWIGTDGGGLNRFDPEHRSFVHYQPGTSKNQQIQTNRIIAICPEGPDTLWLGTFGEGLIKFNTQEETFTCFKYEPNNLQSLSHNYVRDIFMDAVGILWIGTWGGGLNKYDKKRGKFQYYRHISDKPNSLSNNDVWSILEDSQGILWVGTYGGGLNKIDRLNNKYKVYKHQADNPNSIGCNEILAIFEDKRQTLWIGTDGCGLDQLDKKRQRFTHYTHQAGNPHSLSHNEVMSIYADSQENLWIGTNGGGLNHFNIKDKQFSHYQHHPQDPQTIAHDEILSIFEDKSGTLWIGTDGGGLNRLNKKTGQFRAFKTTSQPDSISNNNILCIYEDQMGRMWIGTYGGGLNQFMRHEGTFKHFTVNEGLPDNAVYGILEDKANNLWLSTNKGLCKFNPHTRIMKNYDADDGLQSNEFTQGAFFRSRKGEMFFGGVKGFNAFFPENVQDNPHIPPLVLTSFRVFDKEEKLSKFTTRKNEIKLSYKQNFFSFEFAALDFTAPEKNQYAIKMEGFNKDWIQRGTRTYADYTNVPPGNYVFRVKGSNNDGVWNEEGISLKIKITPPLWKRGWFITILIMFFAVFSYIVINLSRKYLTLITFWKKKNYIGHYKIREQIGTGGMGTVYKAIDIMDNLNTVAIKVIREEFTKDPKLRKRFINEAAIIDQLDHPNIVKVIERGEDNKRLFIAMELLEGPSLGDLIKQGKMIPIKVALDIIIQLVDAIHRIHSKNIIHRDLKPENIMLVEKEQQKYHMKLLDFGLAKAQTITRITDSGMVLGTLNYLAPEQLASGDFSFASDIYSLGIILYEILTLKKPYLGETTIDIMKQILEKDPIQPITFRKDIPQKLNDITLNMIDKSPGNRPTAETLLQELKNFSIKHSIDLIKNLI